MTPYEQAAYQEMQRWQKEMLRRPGLLSGIPKAAQNRINSLIPEKAHQVITKAFEGMTQLLLSGADLITAKPLLDVPLAAREEKVQTQIARYTHAATAEGALTGAGGILWGLADLPLWLSIKIKMLAHIASLYGHDSGDLAERLFMLQVLEITFSSKKHRREVFKGLLHWQETATAFLQNKDTLDWRSFQQEYRDYLDIAKLLQLVPGIGAVVGAAVNRKYTKRLGAYAMNAYRMRWFG